MASGLITSWETEGETVETVRDFIFLGFKSTVDRDCSLPGSTTHGIFQARVLEWGAVILEPQKIRSLTVSTVSPSISHEVMGPDAMILVFRMLS